MAFSYKPLYIFDVQKRGDECVCGAAALITSHEGHDTGYCTECSKKRDNFVSSIVGHVNLTTYKPYFSSLIKIIEDNRKLMTSEKLYYFVDKFFDDNRNNPFEEPYNNLNFIIKSYEQYIHDLEMFIKSLPKSINENGINKLEDEIYRNYISDLSKMLSDSIIKVNNLYQESSEKREIKSK